MLNQCNFIGNLGKDPETRQMASGDSVVNFSVAATERWKDKQGQKQERTEWVNCVAFGKLADICQQYLHKGDKVYVSGKMKTRKWQDDSGHDRYTTEIVLNEMVMLGSPQGDSRPQARPAPAPVKNAAPEGAQAPSAPLVDEDIPF